MLEMEKGPFGAYPKLNTNFLKVKVTMLINIKTDVKIEYYILISEEGRFITCAAETLIFLQAPFQ